MIPLTYITVTAFFWSAAFGSSIHKDPGDPVVAKFLKTIDQVNSYVRENQLDSVKLRPFTFGNILTSVSCTNGFFANLSSFVIDNQLIWENGQEARNNETLYRYKLWLHMEDLVFSYTYDLRIFGIHLNHGTLRVTPVSNEATVVGNVRVSTACRAALDDAEVVGMDILRIEFDDETWFHTIIKYSFDIIVNFVYKSLQSPIQDMVEKFLSVDVFKKQFSDIFCKEFMR